MSCTVVALPISLAWIVGSMAVGTVGAIAERIENSSRTNEDAKRFNELKREEHFNASYVPQAEAITIEKTFKTAFTDKDILMKTLDEHGVSGIQEAEDGTISGIIDSYTLNFYKESADQPYLLKINCNECDNAKEKAEDLGSEYQLNVQEEAYLSIINNLKNNNMEVEQEEVLDDNSIVLTINVE